LTAVKTGDSSQTCRGGGETRPYAIGSPLVGHTSQRRKISDPWYAKSFCFSCRYKRSK